MRVVPRTVGLGGALLAMACGGPGTIAPAGMTPTTHSQVTPWTSNLRPTHARLYEIRPWRFQNDRGAAAGRAVIRVAPPDSLRFDYSGPFRRSGKAAVVGDSALWVVPEEEFSGLIAVAPVFWAALGLPLDPPEGTPLFSLVRDEMRAWRYVLAGDTLNFVLRGSPPTRLLGELRRDGHLLSRSDAELDPETGFVVRARIDFPQEASRFQFTVTGVDTLAAFDPTIWLNQ